MSNTDPQFDDDFVCVWRGIEVEITAEIPKDEYDWATSWSTRERIADADTFCLEFPGITADDDGAEAMIIRHWRKFRSEMSDDFSWAEDCAKQELRDAAEHQNFLDDHAPRMEDMK